MNWASETTTSFLKSKGEKALKKAKRKLKGKKYKLIKVSDKPLTYKEVEIKD